MVKVRFLQSVALINNNRVFGFNDELDIEDQKLVDSLLKRDLIDVLKDEQPDKKKPKDTSKKTKAKEADVNAAD